MIHNKKKLVKRHKNKIWKKSYTLKNAVPKSQAENAKEKLRKNPWDKKMVTPRKIT